MAKANPKQVSLGEISIVQRPSQIKANDNNVTNSYGLNSVMPDAGKDIDVLTRNANAGINIFSATQPYSAPTDDM